MYTEPCSIFIEKRPIYREHNIRSTSSIESNVLYIDIKFQHIEEALCLIFKDQGQCHREQCLICREHHLIFREQGMLSICIENNAQHIDLQHIESNVK